MKYTEYRVDASKSATNRKSSIVIVAAFWIVFAGLALPALGQRDTIPHLVAGLFDWAKFKTELRAPVFQQNDMVIYVLRKDSLGDMISKEENANWMRDWHFVDVNGDRWLDAFYSGATKAREGYYSYFMRADTGLVFPIKLAAPGYVHLIKKHPSGLEFILRDDVETKGYLHKISEYYYDFKRDALDMGWQLQLVNTTEVPNLSEPVAFVLRSNCQMRSTPRMVNEPPQDLNQDGKFETVGNLIATLEPGIRGYRLAQKEGDGRMWDFVVLFDTPANAHVFQPIKGVQMGYAGWIPTEVKSEK